MNAPAQNDPKTDAATRALDTIDVSDPHLYQDDTWQPYFERLRREAPVHYCAESDYGPYWSLSRYKDISDCLVNHAAFSNATGSGVAIEDQPPEGVDDRSFLRMDPPKHTEQRKVVSPVIAPTNLKNMEPMIRQRTQQVLDALPRNETFDWVEHVSVNLTTMMLATLFDFPFEERAKLTYWSDVVTADINAPDALFHTQEERRAELTKMAECMAALFQERRKAPPKFDLLSMLAHNPSTSDMPPHEFIGNLMLLIVGGNDTTRNSMTGGLMALNEFPDEYRKLTANPALVESMVPEMIRYVSPVIHVRRTTVQDVELAGRRIPTGSKVILWYISGNRDEEALEQPNRLVIDRQKPRQHLAFGFGIHRCVGDRLAELQLRVLWEEVLQRFPRIDIMGEPKRAYSNFLRGIRSLPVRIPA